MSRYFRRRKYCRFTAEGVSEIDYKDLATLKNYVMENGKIVLDDTVDKLKENEDIKMFYLGLTEMGTKRSYRDAKFYKRRKRWLT